MSCLAILLDFFLLADTMCSRDIRVWCVCALAHSCVLRMLVRDGSLALDHKYGQTLMKGLP